MVYGRKLMQMSQYEYLIYRYKLKSAQNQLTEKYWQNKTEWFFKDAT